MVTLVHTVYIKSEPFGQYPRAVHDESIASFISALPNLQKLVTASNYEVLDRIQCPPAKLKDVCLRASARPSLNSDDHTTVASAGMLYDTPYLTTLDSRNLLLDNSRLVDVFGQAVSQLPNQISLSMRFTREAVASLNCPKLKYLWLKSPCTDFKVLEAFLARHPLLDSMHFGYGLPDHGFDLPGDAKYKTMYTPISGISATAMTDLNFMLPSIHGPDIRKLSVGIGKNPESQADMVAALAREVERKGRQVGRIHPHKDANDRCFANFWISPPQHKH